MRGRANKKHRPTIQDRRRTMLVGSKEIDMILEEMEKAEANISSKKRTNQSIIDRVDDIYEKIVRDNEVLPEMLGGDLLSAAIALGVDGRLEINQLHDLRFKWRNAIFKEANK
jgi:hypothetical protein